MQNRCFFFLLLFLYTLFYAQKFNLRRIGELSFLAMKSLR